MTATFTSDFHHEFEQERSRWLRRRFLWYVGVTVGMSIAAMVLGAVGYLLAGLADEENARIARQQFSGASLIGVVPGVVSLVAYVWAFLHVRRRLLGREAILRIVYWLIVAGGALSIIGGIISYQVQRPEIDAAIERAAAMRAAQSSEARAGASGAQGEAAMQADAGGDASGEKEQRFKIGTTTFSANDKELIGALVGMSGFTTIFFSHFFACLFLPWTPRESIRPILPLLGLNAVVTLLYMGSAWKWGVASIALSPLVAAPGAAICWWRQGRFKDRFHYSMLRGRYSQLKQELTDARRIHESLFPRPVTSGAVRFDFRYQPMRQIGGDFLYINRFSGGAVAGEDGSEPLSIVIIDVTGHGIPAALTVNRLHGELERLFAEDPDIEPGDVLTALNRYVHLTLATHSVYATALCLRVDPRQNEIAWASGGHPPAFLRTVDSRLERLDSTSFVLGACHGDDFKHGQLTLRMGPGDTLIAYTDGATEARNERGGMMRVEGLQTVIARLAPKAMSSGGWAGAVLEEVDRHRFGPPADDTLVVEVWRPIVPSTRSGHGSEASSKPRSIEV